MKKALKMPFLDGIFYADLIKFLVVNEKKRTR